jgi:starch phosphorylase
MDTIRRVTRNHFSLPRRIYRLGELANNLWWVWQPDVQQLYTLADKNLWEMVLHNPVSFLHKVERSHLNEVTNDRFYLELYDHSMAELDRYLKASNTWFQRTYPDLTSRTMAYFSFEFGLHESLPVYAGGLGILSGDHLKEASDLGMPLVGVGFIYNQGYFTQHITEDGWQETRNYIINYDEIPVTELLHQDGQPVTISVDLVDRKVLARVWQVQVGRIPLYLLDTNLEQNSPTDRQMTARLYSNDPDIRVSQEMLLGVGGVRALRTLGYNPDLWHMNEGHSAFLAIERLRERVTAGDSYEVAAQKVQKNNVFTTHTPVPAGNDQFPIWLVEKYFSNIWPELNLTRDEFIDLGRYQSPWGENFCMPVLALHLSNQRNGVSELHGQVSREMWKPLWPNLKVEDVPITHITNGVHTGTWLARRMSHLFNQHLGADWMEHLEDPNLWDGVLDIPNEALWQVRQHLKRKLINFAMERIRGQWTDGSVHPVQVIAGGVLMQPFALTIGFARRFATYKRGSLILRDVERLLKIDNNPNMPVQIVFAGKAHPADEPGKMLIQEVYRSVKNAQFAGRLVFLEDYDMNVAHYLVQGVDVWLNTPRRPNEASGTSGMKAALNGVLNFSVLDGWWHEGFNGHNGWAIGDDSLRDDLQQDEFDALSLYETLENEIVPLYYQRRSDDKLPVEWMALVKESMRTLIPQFSLRRMLQEYMSQMYLPALQTDSAEETPQKA